MAFPQVPGARQAGVEVEADEDDALVAAGGFLPGDELHQEPFRLGHAGDGADNVKFTLAHGQGDFEVLGTAGDDPEICLGVTDDDGGRVGEAEKEPELHGDQDNGEDNPHQGDGEAGAVVGQVAPGQEPGHAAAPEGTRTLRMRGMGSRRFWRTIRSIRFRRIGRARRERRNRQIRRVRQGRRREDLCP